MLDKELRQVQFDMLMDNDLRREKLGEKILLIENVAIDGGAFNGESWEFIHFKDVDFYKGFTQATLKNVTFENCRFLDCTFAAIALEEVAFVKCKTKGQVFITAGKAKNLVFDGCDFTDNKETNQNNWGSIYFEGGNVLYKNCKAKLVRIYCYEKSHFVGCAFENVGLPCGHAASEPKRFADVTIENCTFKKEVSMLGGLFANLNIKNTSFETILFPNTIRDNLIVDSLNGNDLEVDMRNPVKNITIKNCEFRSGNGDQGQLYIEGNSNPIQADTLTVENIKAGIGGTDKSGGTYQTGKRTQIKNIEAARWSFALQGESLQLTDIKATNKVTFENIKGQEANAPSVIVTNFNVANLTDFKGVMLPTLIIDGYKGNTLDLSDTKIERLEIKNSRVETLLDLTNAHVGSGEFSTLSGSKKIKVITKGSNLDVKDGTLYVVPPKA